MTAPVQPWRWIRLEIGLVVNGGIQYALFIDHPLFWPALGLTTLLLLLLLLWPRSLPAASRPPPRDIGSQAQYWRDVAGHVYALLPLWAGHIALGREQIDEAAGRLTGHCDNMLRQLGYQAPEPADAAAEQKTADAPLLGAPSGLSPPDRMLMPMLKQLQQSALQLEALAQARENSQPDGQIASQVGNLLRQLETLERDSQPPPGQKRDGNAAGFDLRAAAEDTLTQLQFQDRVNQILSHVQNDIWQLEAMLHEALSSEDELPAPPDTEAWLSALKSSYTTHEQRALHNRDGGDRPPGPSDITFF
ncbi:hypothetical protein KIF53_08810 [Chromobacterium subtsugae]|uniref:Uncharacterized protein n=1 Tax=Chromobacterium subtsugae TaxID=251747 RepID=A0ABS7FCA8_9NEIS|nr:MULTISPECIES: hypothetical protein [Chromobacterium]KUM04669.1 hypothetical protein Cv017_13420 [Chromobacterium subtsugae]KZE85783.1 hypothetical protein AWB61_01740 [Chromobacterium sp. F49]MBW7566418.1 hypothetical protein [Chromobacterium subtsugae]MBW8287723.1 hypothetical protein [Chromobacterium subtsugae]WSE91055.1 hypothetical protein U6115_19595 [Chromobacterium subtsugae]